NKAGHAIGLLHSESQIKKAVLSSVTDSNNEVRYEFASAGIKNLINIYCAITKKTPELASKKFENHGYGYLKKAVLEEIINLIRPIQEKYQKLIKNPDYLFNIAKKGQMRAREIASKKMTQVRKTIGIR